MEGKRGSRGGAKDCGAFQMKENSGVLQRSRTFSVLLWLFSVELLPNTSSCRESGAITGLEYDHLSLISATLAPAGSRSDLGFT